MEEFEKEIIKKFINKAMEISEKIKPNQINFFSFPSKFSFICNETQKDLCVEFFEKIRINQKNLHDIKPEVQQGGAWFFEQTIEKTKEKTMKFMKKSIEKQAFPKESSKILELSYFLGIYEGNILLNKEIFIFLDEFSKKLYFSQEKIDEFKINLHEMREFSLKTSEKKVVVFNDLIGKFQFYDEKADLFMSYEEDITKALETCQKIHKKTLKYHRNSNKKLVESVFSFDLNRFLLKKNQQLSVLDSSPLQDIKISRQTNEKHNKILQKIPILSDLIEKIPLKIIENKINEPIKLKEPNKCSFIKIRSYEKDLKKPIEFLEEILQRKSIKHIIRLKSNKSQAFFDNLQRICDKNNLNLLIHKEIGIELFGNLKTIKRIRPEILKLSEIDEKITYFPSEWVFQTENLIEIDLKADSEEYTRISQAFLSTCKENYEMVGILRIQNKKLWENYDFERKKMNYKGNSLEKMLFHGSKENFPSLIYSGIEEGFDVRLSNFGSLGNCIYFSEDADYCANGFSFVKGNGNFLLIYANVLIGNCCELKKSKSFNAPPMMPNDNGRRYDSVKMRYIYGIYNSNRAYPAYVIEYKKKKGLTKIF